ncbi:peroxiredoxin family protein [Jeotgalibacillus proteolyticus]|uniref:Thiol-disulfide oxidoreductase n=1 Tax=Jeotgalibacillus proteolyticus TaxID=2082395 RepID=A0A2S5G8X5_9BACL|nr:TlpA disulfide reductase family protein [Jeotgalibacillus proteolyticus]PPA69457.1 thiol-disulfide oxidoreductase [Jeotgalibacillus proteolyticus]
MYKQIAALLLVGGLVTILILNVIEDKNTWEAEQARQLTYEVKPSQNDQAQVVPSDGVLKEGQRAPDFETTTADGETVSLSDYEGKKVILNFWATWCPPCIEEMPHMQKYYEENAEDQNTEILAVNLTTRDNGADRVRSFVEDYELTFPVLLDESGSLGDQFYAFTIPTTYILNEEGIITKKLMGPMNQEMMIELMEETE